jgi:(4-alkanoyl-5-oxo-2,5-dihydrofuran-3-yl)methyl phosphate reductase
MEILISGATGDVGSKVVKQLLARGVRPRVFARDAAKARAMFRNCVDVFTGDLGDAPVLRAAMEGVDALFLVNSGPRIPVLDELAAKAAKDAGVRLLVKLSSLDVEQSLAIGAWHEKGEAAIRGSGVAFTFVRPSGFMSNLLAWAHSIKAEGVVRSSTGSGKRPFIHSEDIAAVAVRTLTTGEYVGEALPLTGPEALSFGDITAKIGNVIGRKLRFQAISDDEAGRRFAAATGASAEETAAHLELWRAIREGRLATVTDGVKQVLGREPIGMERWIEENAGAFAENAQTCTTV